MSRSLFNSLSLSSIGTPSLVPSEPNELKVVRANTTSVNLRWIDTAASESYFNVYATTSSISSSYSVVGTFTASAGILSTPSGRVIGLLAGTNYFFKIKSVHTSSGLILESIDSNIVSASTTPYITASGGTVTSASGFKMHVFTGSGTLQVLRGGSDVDVIAIGAGGGGGAGINGAYAGGGGGGGYTYESGSFFLWSGSYTVTVGNGGAKGTYFYDEENEQDVLNYDEQNGQASLFTGSVIKEAITLSGIPLSASGDPGRFGTSADTTGTSGGRAGNIIINGVAQTPTFYSGGFSNGIYGGGGGGAGGYGGNATSTNGTGGSGVTFFGTTYATGSVGGSNTNGHGGAVIIRYPFPT